MGYVAELDHLVLGTADLAKGSRWLESFFGVELSDIGVHATMGTHNRLLSLGPGVYLELIAIDRSAPAPQQPRWFGLDTADVQEKIASRPRLIGWVARTNELAKIDEATGGVYGRVLPMQRGNYAWAITVPEDGYALEGGLVPNLIEWRAGGHPSERLQDQGCRFTWMEAAHPQPGKVAYLLEQIGLQDKLVLTATPPYSGMTMCAYVQTPKGMRTLMA